MSPIIPSEVGPISPIYCPGRECAWSAHGIPDKYVDARKLHLAIHRAEEHGGTLTDEQVARAKRLGYDVPTQRATEPTAAITPTPLSPAREVEIREHVGTTTNWSLGNLAARDLLAEVDRLRGEVAELEAQRDKLIRWHNEDATELRRLYAIIPPAAASRRCTLHGEACDGDLTQAHIMQPVPVTDGPLLDPRSFDSPAQRAAAQMLNADAAERGESR